MTVEGRVWIRRPETTATASRSHSIGKNSSGSLDSRIWGKAIFLCRATSARSEKRMRECTCKTVASPPDSPALFQKKTLSSSGLGHSPFTGVTRVRIPLGSPSQNEMAIAAGELPPSFHRASSVRLGRCLTTLRVKRSNFSSSAQRKASLQTAGGAKCGAYGNTGPIPLGSPFSPEWRQGLTGARVLKSYRRERAGN